MERVFLALVIVDLYGMAPWALSAHDCVLSIYNSNQYCFTRKCTAECPLLSKVFSYPYHYCVGFSTDACLKLFSTHNTILPLDSLQSLISMAILPSIYIYMYPYFGWYFVICNVLVLSVVYMYSFIK